MRLCAAVALVAALAASASAAESRHITAKLMTKPTDLAAQIRWTAGVRLRSNGRLLKGARPLLTARSGSRSRSARLRESRVRGLYRGTLVFPVAGRWSLTVRVGRSVARLGSVSVGPPRPDVRGPFDLALGPSGELAIADRDADRVLVVDLRSGRSTVAAAGLDDPIAVAYDPAGRLYANSGERILRFENGGATVVAGTGVRGHSGDGGAATSARFGGLGAFDFSPSGDLYVPEYDNWIRRVRTDGIIETIAGTGAEGYGGDGGPARIAAIAAPHALTVRTDGSIVIADSHNGRIRRIDGSGVMTTLADGFTAPVSIAAAPDGSVVVGDARTNLLERVGGQGVRSIVASGLRLPSGVAVDAAGNVYVSEFDASRVRRIAARTGRITTVAR